MGRLVCRAHSTSERKYYYTIVFEERATQKFGNVRFSNKFYEISFLGEGPRPRKEVILYTVYDS